VATLERVVERARELGGIWIASAGEIAAHVKQSIPASEARPVAPVQIEEDVYGG
jgi:hypothetical protein